MGQAYGKGAAVPGATELRHHLERRHNVSSAEPATIVRLAAYWTWWAYQPAQKRSLQQEVWRQPASRGAR